MHNRTLTSNMWNKCMYLHIHIHIRCKCPLNIYHNTSEILQNNSEKNKKQMDNYIISCDPKIKLSITTINPH